MTRNKAIQTINQTTMASTTTLNPVSNASTSSAPAPTAAPLNNNGISASVPDFSTTLGGNAFFELGDAELSDADFAAMLQNYNNSLPTPTTTRMENQTRRQQPPVLYNERTEEAQNDVNFYSPMFDFETISEFLTAEVDMDAFFNFNDASLPSTNTQSGDNDTQFSAN